MHQRRMAPHDWHPSYVAHFAGVRPPFVVTVVPSRRSPKNVPCARIALTTHACTCLRLSFTIRPPPGPYRRQPPIRFFPMFLTPHLDWLFASRPHHDQGFQIVSEVSEATDLTCTKTEAVVVPKIPQDIVYEILDHLIADPSFRSSLRSCSLVSKSWVTPCRHHLFHTISFKFADTFRWIRGFPVQEQSPAHHVRELSLSLEGYAYAPHEFFKRLQWFTNVKKVTLSGGRDKDWLWTTSPGRLPQSVTSLAIDSADSIGILRIRDVMLQLPNLNDFSLSGPLRTVKSNGSQGVGRDLRGKFGGRLQLYRLQGCYTDVLNMLLEVPTGLWFTELDICSPHECFLSTVSLAEACGESLVRLSYTAIEGKYRPDGSCIRNADADNMPRIRSTGGSCPVL